MNILTIDFETFYSREYSLSKMTTEAYVRDPRFEVIGVGIKIDAHPTEWYSGSDVEESTDLSTDSHVDKREEVQETTPVAAFNALAIEAPVFVPLDQDHEVHSAVEEEVMVQDPVEQLIPSAAEEAMAEDPLLQSQVSLAISA